MPEPVLFKQRLLRRAAVSEGVVYDDWVPGLLFAPCRVEEVIGAGEQVPRQMGKAMRMVVVHVQHQAGKRLVAAGVPWPIQVCIDPPIDELDRQRRVSQHHEARARHSAR